MPIVTFNSDAHPESTSVDGEVKRENPSPEETWATIRAGAGNGSSDSDANLRVGIQSEDAPNTGKWYAIRRSILLFDTSSIPASANIVSAKVSISVGEKTRTNITGGSFAIYASTPATNTALVDADYSALGTTALSDAISYDNINAAGWNDFILNAAGRAAITKEGITKFGWREATYDAPNNEPAWVALISLVLVAISADSDSDPILSVTYTTYTTYPSDAMARVSSIRHIFQPGMFRMQVGLGDLGFDVDVAETSVRKTLDTATDDAAARQARNVESVMEQIGAQTAEKFMALINEAYQKAGRPIPEEIATQAAQVAANVERHNRELAERMVLLAQQKAEIDKLRAEYEATKAAGKIVVAGATAFAKWAEERTLIAGRFSRGEISFAEYRRQLDALGPMPTQ